MQVNFWGSVYCTHYALRFLKKTKGRIVVIISAGGKFVTPGACGYGASKHAMVGFFDTLRMELAETGVSVTAIYPEWVATGISARNLEANGKPRGKIVAQEQGAMLPEECARLILKAAAERRRDTLSPNLKLGLLLSPIIPNIPDKIAARTFEGPD